LFRCQGYDVPDDYLGIFFRKKMTAVGNDLTLHVLGY
jgi:hypothetical protein